MADGLGGELREQLLRQVEEGLQTALDAAQRAGLGRDEIVRMLDGLMGANRGPAFAPGRPVPGPVALRQDVGVVLDHTYLVGDWRLAEVERTLRPLYDRWDTGRYRQATAVVGSAMAVLLRRPASLAWWMTRCGVLPSCWTRRRKRSSCSTRSAGAA